ncbi:Type 1 glutamine amidotransferase-like domain-containing protein [Chloroflexi bacterium TSY]|nr:Type 1 glutamine amidotransferase-like domain-containing protein [Chloroflexi bacterium TSY]
MSEHEASELDTFNSVYIGGGNTFSLLGELIDSGFDQILRRYVTEGMPIYGGSAGAVVLGKNIRTVEHIDSNNIGLERRDCLDLALGSSIWVHYQPSDDTLIQKYINTTHYNVLAISERSGVIIVGNRIQSVGFESAYRFETGKKQEL